jgi:hypothetical protein
MAEGEPEPVRLFEDGEIQANDVRSTAGNVYERLAQRLSTFSQLAIQSADIQTWNEVLRLYQRANKDFAQLTRELDQFTSSNNREGALPVLRRMETLVVTVNAHVRELVLLADIRDRHSFNAEALRDVVQQQVETARAHLSAELDTAVAHAREQVENGIKELLGLKAELQLSGNFHSTVQKRMKANKHASWWSFAFATACLAVLAVAMIAPLYIEAFPSDVASTVLFRFSVGLPILLLWSHLVALNRTYRVAALKYENILGFLGGGASEIAEVTKRLKEIDSEEHRRLLAMIMGLDDLTHTVVKPMSPAQLRKLLGPLLGDREK